MPAPSDLIFLPGLLCDAALWRAPYDGLRDVICPHVADLTQDSTLADMARRVLAQAPERFALAALSMGGYVAFEILRQAPDRVERLALLDTTARPDTPEQSEVRRTLMALARRGEFKGVSRRLLPRLVHPARQEGPVADAVIAMAERVGRQAFLRQQNAILGRPDSRRDLAAIRCPTLVLHGRDDALTPPEAHAEMAALIPRSALVAIEECGHLSPLEQPHAVTAVLRYWLQV